MRPISRPTVLSDEGRTLRNLTGLDWQLVLLAVLLCLVGMATVHSATTELMPQDYLSRQAVWIGLGLVVMALAVALDYHLLLDFSSSLYLLGLLSLVAVLFIGEGPGSTRSWFEIGSTRIGQPAEFAKLGAILFLARYLAVVDHRFLSVPQIFLASGIVALPMGLIVLQPDLGSAAMYAPMLAGMLLVAGVRLRVLVVTAGILVLLGAGVWNFGMRDYQRDRVSTFLAPDSDPLGAGYQVRQSKIAVGSGQLFGRGYMQGTQSQLRFLPARHTDFIFAVLAEEWGFLGVVATLGLFGFYVFTALRIGMRARDRVGILLVVGVVSVFSFHVLYNTAMVVGMLPITGIPLPFLSYGGSFMLFNFFATGLILNVDIRRHVNR